MNVPALTPLCALASISPGHDKSCDFWMEITRILTFKLSRIIANLFSKMAIKITLGAGDVG